MLVPSLSFNKRYNVLSITEDPTKIEGGEQTPIDNLDNNVLLAEIKFNINNEIELVYDTSDKPLSTFVYAITNNYRTVVLNASYKIPFDVCGIEHILHVGVVGNVNLELAEAEVCAMHVHVTTKENPLVDLPDFKVTPLGYQLQISRVKPKPPVLASEITLENVDTHSHISAANLGRSFAIPKISSIPAVQLSFLQAIQASLDFQIEQVKKQLS